VFDLLPEATVVLEPKAEARREAALEQVADAHASRAAAAPGESPRPPQGPDRLYLTAEEWEARLEGRPVVALQDQGEEAADAVPRFAAERAATALYGEFLEEQAGLERRIVLAAASGADRKALARRAKAVLDRTPEPAADWAAVLASEPGALLTLDLDLDAGFVDADSGTALVAAADLLGSRAGAAGTEAPPVATPFGVEELHIGDAVIHRDYGMGILRGLEAVSVAGGEPEEVAALEYHGEAKLLVPTGELDRVWRYGSDPEAVTLDRLDGEAWTKRREALEAEIAEAAQGLVALAEARQEREAPRLVPPRAPYERFVARFPFTETADQARAIADTLRDLGSGRPMDRLVCGDVGFGKTEVALRAAAAAALSGRQVAIVAPTTVLVRQHLATVRRRFRGLGIAVGHLSRLAKPAEAKAVKEGLADGSIRVVVGTHAVAAKGVSFRDLGLVVIDEEQRFGAAQKTRLHAMAGDAHVLTLTATPIPRTLQAALVGLQELSLITTPPARRRPIRTFLTPFDAVTAREALVRERARGGQSFVVCPRVEDIAPMAERLAKLVPELQVFTAHGKMPADAIDDAMVRFADGEGDVLLATNIIESGLDVPRANTMLVWRPDRFGLAQLHQLRGRVGRGRVRGVCYLLTDPAAKIPEATLKRLSTLEALDRLGAGFAISARDLDMRGAGDLLGEEQAGHLKLIGSGLYQHLLERALRRARGRGTRRSGRRS
jgi:transcription-repair coupling factor (superfamily II helicase)